MISTTGMRHPALFARVAAQAAADLYGGEDRGPAADVWMTLGFRSRVEHDAMLATIAEVRELWPADLDDACTRYVADERARLRLLGPPYSIDDMDTLDRLIRRAPTVVAQDSAAEGSAA